MNEELQSRLLDYLTKLEQGGNFVLDQAPAIAQEYLQWYWISSITTLVIGSLILLASITLFIVGYFVAKTDHWRQSPNGYQLLGGILLVLSSTLIPIGAYQSVKVTYAPRVVLIEAVKYEVLK